MSSAEARTQYETIVTQWRQTFDGDLSLAAQVMSGKLETLQWPEKKSADRQARWVKLQRSVKSALVRLELLRNTDFAKDRAADLIVRLENMATWPADPLVTKWLVDVFGRQTRAPVLDGQKCFRRVFTALETTLDHAGAETLKGWLGGHEARIGATAATAKFFDDGLRRVLERSSERLASAPPLSDAERAVLRKAGLLTLPAVPREQRDVTSLEQQVFARPDDDGPRLVLADALQQQTLARGEFIALDCVHPRTEEQQRRRAELLKRHAKAFLPEGLASLLLVQGIEYHRGFPVSGVLKNGRQKHPAFATFRELVCSQTVVDLPTLDAPCFAQVVSVLGLSLRLATIASHARVAWGRRLRRLGIDHALGAYDTDKLPQVIRELTGPALEQLVLGQVSSWHVSHFLRPAVLAEFKAFLSAVERDLPSLQSLFLWNTFVFERREGRLRLTTLQVAPWLRALVADDSRATPELVEGWRAVLREATGPVSLEGASGDTLAGWTGPITIARKLSSVVPSVATLR